MQAFGDYEVVSHQEFPECSLRILRMRDGQEVSRHFHNVSTQMYLGFGGTVEVWVEGRAHRIASGEGVRVPAGAVHAVRPVDGDAIVLSVSVPPLRTDDHFTVQG